MTAKILSHIRTDSLLSTYSSPEGTNHVEICSPPAVLSFSTVGICRNRKETKLMALSTVSYGALNVYFSQDKQSITERKKCILLKSQIYAQSTFLFFF